METGLALTLRGVAVVPSAKLQSSTVVTRPEDENIPLAQFHALRHLARLEFGAAHSLSGFEPSHASEVRDIQEHAAANQPVAVTRDVLVEGALRVEYVVGWPCRCR